LALVFREKLRQRYAEPGGQSPEQHGGGAALRALHFRNHGLADARALGQFRQAQCLRLAQCQQARGDERIDVLSGRVGCVSAG
jgi:hypothetical protein